MAKTKETLAIGKQRDGILRRSENVYMVRVRVGSGKRE